MDDKNKKILAKYTHFSKKGMIFAYKSKIKSRS